VSDNEKMQVDEAALRRLELLSLFLESDPAIIDSMPIDEVTRDLWELGLEPIGRVGTLEVPTDTIPKEVPRVEGVPLFNASQVRKDLVIQEGSVEELFSRLQDVGAGLAPWLTQVCTRPLNVFRRFAGARTIEEFFQDNRFEEPNEIPLSMDFAREDGESIDLPHLSLIALYPSGALRSVPCSVTVCDGKLSFVIADQLTFVDPDVDQPLSNIPSFWAQITLFAVGCV
jgi:hypothetical protein